MIPHSKGMESFDIVKRQIESLPPWHRVDLFADDDIRSEFITRLNVELFIPRKEVELGIARYEAFINKDYHKLIALSTEIAPNVLEAWMRSDEDVEVYIKNVVEPQVKILLANKHMDTEGASIQEAFGNMDLEKINVLEVWRNILEKNSVMTLSEHDAETGVVSAKHNERYRTHQQNVLGVLKDAPNVLDKPMLTKTEILKALRMDGGRHRSLNNDVLDYLTLTLQVKKIGAKYYHPSNNTMTSETEFHRKVYESLEEGPISITGIVKTVGYNNSYGRRKVRHILSLLADEGLVTTKYHRWQYA